MADYWPLYITLLGGSVTDSSRDTIADEAVQSFADGIVNDPAYQSDAVVNGEVTPIVASRKSTLKCLIKALPNTDIHIGDMVRCFNEDWIVVELYVDKVGIINGEIWLCNDSIRFQNHSHVINTRRCVVDDGTYSKKSSDPDAFVMANTYKIYITIDEATKKIFVDKRLAFGTIYSAYGEEILEVYKIIGMDVKSKNFGEGSHLMVLTVQRDIYNEESDSLSQNLCDVYKGNDDSLSYHPMGGCVIAGSSTIRIGASRKYTATFTDAGGNVVDGIAPAWAVDAPEGVSYRIDDSGTCVINVLLQDKIVGETITITASDSEGAFGEFTKKVQVVTVG